MNTPLQTPQDEPLTMTVHSLPEPSGAAQRRTTGRFKMIAVLLVCAAPVIASYFTFYVVRPTAQRNYGELTTPPRAAPDVALQPILLANAASTTGVATPGTAGASTVAGAVAGAASQTSAPFNGPTNLRALKGQWTLLSLSSGDCAASCEKHIYLQRQLRESLGREKDRMDRVVLITDDLPLKPAVMPAMSDPANDAYALRITAAGTTGSAAVAASAALADWLTPAAGHKLADHLYLIDPMGNWMLRFPADLDAAKAKRDIERLLRASSSWDRAGREDKALSNNNSPTTSFNPTSQGKP